MRTKYLSNSVFLFTAMLLTLPAVQLRAAEPLRLFVSLEGDDAGSGRFESPFRTLEAARNAVRQESVEVRTKQPIEICIFPGTYFREKPFVLDARDSGTKTAPVIYRSWGDQAVVISGGRKVEHWQMAELNGQAVLVADLTQLPGGYQPFEQMWVNGHRATQARTPNQGYLQIPDAPQVEKHPAAERRARTNDFRYAQADAHYLNGVEDGVAVVFNKWLEYHMPLDHVDRQNHKIVCTKRSDRALEVEDHYYLEGGRAMLDQPGEWYLDRQAGKLYYYPLPNEAKVVAIIPHLVTVLQVDGDADQGEYVEHVAFRGLTFSHTTWVLPRDEGPSGYSQADIRMDGAVRLLDARNCRFEDCEITAIGNYAFEIGSGCEQNRVLRCDIHDLGAGGFLVGPKIRPPSDKEDPNRTDFPPVLENPLDACSHNEIADCRVYDGGRYYHCAVGIWIGQSPSNNVHHNEIYNFYYSGISSGWTWGYGRALATGNRFEYNHIHHIGRWTNGDGAVLSDLGGIYTLGDQTGTKIRHNRFHDIWAGKYGGWAIYCDEGSRNILIENNLAYRCRHACFNQHYGKNNIVRNNIFAFADTSMVMMGKAQSHTGFILTNNILLSDETPIYAGGYAYKVKTPGAFKASKNLVWSLAGPVMGAQDRFPSRLYEPNEPVMSWQQWQALGNDRDSVIADPGFRDPANGDFSLPQDSPALGVGFIPFPLDEAGPRARNSANADETPQAAQAANPFIHPGLLHSRAELAFIQEKLASGKQPWKSAWDQLQSSKAASLDYTPKPRANVVRGAYNRPDFGSSDMSSDAVAAYAHALQWSLTEKKVHATKAIEILNAWASTLESISGHDAKLLVGMDGVAFCNAAELLRHTSTEWSGEDQKQFERMLRHVLYPVIEEFYPTANGNWDASMIQTMIAIGVFLDDHAMFDRAVEYYRHGKGNGAIEKYFNEFGECQESGRDQSHVQMGIGFLACACEMAWKQGVDLYGAADNRLALGFEYTAKYNLGEDVPYQRYRSVGGRYDYPTISRRGRGRFRPIYERIVHHYHDRMGMDMPFSQRVADKKRPEGAHRQHMSWGTLTSYGLPVASSSLVAAEGPVVLGHGAGLFQGGALLAQDDFENLDNWVVQIQERPGFEPEKVVAMENSLDCFLPGRGCTVWFKQKLPTRVAIMYDVLCPTPKPAIKGLQPRDINNFWMASDPVDPDQGLFDSNRYTGKFSSYDKIHGYYASTGGGGAIANLTTRMRRYPRAVDSNPAEHLALNDKDGKPGYLITPDKVMAVQLVAYDDLIQYVVDGKLVYQIARGDRIQVEGRDGQGKPTVREEVYDLDRFPVYRMGYFGFRMVGTHHIYTNFRVYALKPEDGTATTLGRETGTEPSF